MQPGPSSPHDRPATSGSSTIPVHLSDATLTFDRRTLWRGLTLDVEPGEFLAVLGPNGAGKTSLLKVLLGLGKLTSGTVEVCGQTPSRGSDVVGYIPQQRALDRDLPLRGRDLVRLGLDGHRWGIGRLSREDRRRLDAVIEQVGATDYADAPLGLLSGGEQQRLRIAQALLARPRVLLCDEPLLSLDLHHQVAATDLIDRQRREQNMAVIFVTHEINPILPVVDRVLYFAAGRWAVGSADEVLTTECLSDLYQSRVDVLRIRDRIVVVGAGEAAHADHAAHAHHAADSGFGIDPGGPRR